MIKLECDICLININMIVSNQKSALSPIARMKDTLASQIKTAPQNNLTTM